MRIVWILLSIIGIIWAVLLLLFLLALFVPIRYRIYGRKKEDMLAEGSASWFWRLLSASLAYKNGELGFQLRVLGIPIGRKKPKEPPESESEEREQAPEVIALERPAPEKASEEEEEPPNEAETLAEAEPAKEAEILEEAEPPEEEAKEKAGQAKKKKKAKNEKAKEEEKPKGKLELVKQFWQENQVAVRLVFTKAIRLLKALRPKKLRASLWFGTGDPCTTGELTGALAMLYGFYGENIHIYPDFSQAIFMGEVTVEGKIRLFTFFWIGLTLFIDKNVWRLIKNIKHLKEEF